MKGDLDISVINIIVAMPVIQAGAASSSCNLGRNFVCMTTYSTLISL